MNKKANDMTQDEIRAIFLVRLALELRKRSTLVWSDHFGRYLRRAS
jgi:hypothetical protein